MTANKIPGVSASEVAIQEEMPVLETERLILRAFRQPDFSAYHGMVSDTDVVRYVGQGVSLNTEQAWQSMAYLMGHWWLKGFGLWAVEEKSSGRVVGRVGLYQPEGWPGMELGWMIAKEHWRKGFAFEAAQAALAYQRTHFPQEPLISLIHSENKPSIKLAQKLGASFSLGREMGNIQVLEFSYPDHA
ncbi:GNAT family N-acetyltransferase [Oceanospirillum sp.]|uniref:GNAT family N-acetyltransferase n=1 Tax=Oceanospirillum sp. TaxID=2021254 RepID=UPI003A8CC69B